MNVNKTSGNAKQEQTERPAQIPLRGSSKTGMAIAAAGLMAMPVANASVVSTNEMAFPKFTADLTLSQPVAQQLDSVNPFNTKLGTLDYVEIQLSGTANISVSENGLKGSTFDIMLNTFFDTKGDALNGGNPVDTLSYTFKGGSSQSMSKSLSWTDTETFTSPSILALFEGSKPVSLYETVKLSDSISTLTKSENINDCGLNVSVKVQDLGDIIYGYSPRSVPEPKESELLLTGAVAVGALSLLRRKQNKESAEE